MGHVAVQCDQCGQTDDHPKAHFGGGRTVHHHCMSADERAVAFGSTNGDHLRKITEAAESGTRGEELRAFIARTHPDTERA